MAWFFLAQQTLIQFARFAGGQQPQLIHQRIFAALIGLADFCPVPQLIMRQHQRTIDRFVQCVAVAGQGTLTPVQRFRPTAFRDQPLRQIPQQLLLKNRLQTRPFGDDPVFLHQGEQGFIGRGNLYERLNRVFAQIGIGDSQQIQGIASIGQIDIKCKSFACPNDIAFAQGGLKTHQYSTQ